MRRYLALSGLLFSVGIAVAGSIPSQPRRMFVVELVDPTTVVHEPLPFSISLDGNGRFHDLQSFVIEDGELPKLLRSGLCVYNGKCIVDLVLSNQRTTTLTTLSEAVGKIKKSADPKRETQVYVYVPLYPRGQYNKKDATELSQISGLFKLREMPSFSGFPPLRAALLRQPSWG